MLDRLLSTRTTSTNGPKDCLECRLIGGGGLTALASYIGYKTYTARHSMTKWSLIGSSCLATVILSVAAMRLMAINFNHFGDKNIDKQQTN